MPFNSDNLQLFLTVLEKGSFSAAARALHRVPSAVSMAVSNLEAELGFALFERSGRAPVPTERALALAPYAREITDKIHQLNVFTRELTQDVESTLAVGVATCVNPQDLFSALQILNQRYPLLKTEILSGHRMTFCRCCIRGGSSWHWFSAGCMWIHASSFTVSVMKLWWPPFQPRILLYLSNSLFILRIWYRQNKSLLPVFTILSLMCVHRWRRKPGRLIIFRWRWDWLKRVSAGGICRNR